MERWNESLLAFTEGLEIKKNQRNFSENRDRDRKKTSALKTCLLKNPADDEKLRASFGLGQRTQKLRIGG